MKTIIADVKTKVRFSLKQKLIILFSVGEVNLNFNKSRLVFEGLLPETQATSEKEVVV